MLAEIEAATDALAKGLGRGEGAKRKPRSKALRDALARCAATLNAVHEEIAWFAEATPPGADRDRLTALLAPLEALLERHQPVAVAAADEAPAAPAAPPKPA